MTLILFITFIALSWYFFSLSIDVNANILDLVFDVLGAKGLEIMRKLTTY
jgi:hypothetical protein